MLRLPNILIVDDSATTRAMIKRIIGMTELPVDKLLEAQDGSKALEAMNSIPVHLVLADLNMPVMGGAEMIEHMRRDPGLSHIPVLIISAQPDEELTERLKASGVAGYLPKPFTPEGVRDLIGPLVKRLSVVIETRDSRNALRAGLCAALAEALETMSFIAPELDESVNQALSKLVHKWVHVDFHGQGVSGMFTLSAPPELGAEIAANCGDLNPSAADDALKELANVACGLLLRRIEGGAKGFEVTPPVMAEPEDGQAIPIAGDSVVLSAEGYRIIANVVASVPLRLNTEVLS